MTKLLSNGPEVLALGREALLVLALLFQIERARLRVGPRSAIRAARRLGEKCRTREPAQRALLRKAIRWVDRRLPFGTNCYRRVLLEVALDRGAASEKVVMGFRRGGGKGSGHAWLESDPPAAIYDAIVSL